MRLTSFLLMISCATSSFAKPAADAPLMVGADQKVAGEIADKPAVFLMMASGPRTLFLNADAIARFGINGGPFGGEGRIGPIRKKISSAVVTYGLRGFVSKRRVIWTDSAFVSGADAGLGPAAVSNPVVTFQMRAPRSSEKTFALPMTEIQGSFGALGTIVEINGQPIQVLFDLTHDATLVTAAAAATLSASHAAQMTGAVRQEVVRLEVQRPVRQLTLGRAFEVGPLRLSSMLARTGDNSNGQTIADADGDSSEIVVTALNSKQKPLYSLNIGRTALSACSSLTFDKARKEIRLQCASIGG